MRDQQVACRTGQFATLSAEAVRGFAEAFHGRLLTPGSPGYDQARTVWNAMIDRCPALVAQCGSGADVVHAIRFARDHNLLVAVRGGGHNIAGNAVCDSGLMIDLSPMRAVSVDPERRTARVGAGATLGDFDREAQAHALATPLGVNSTTGVAGLTLGGGFGWLSRRYGLTIDNLLGADVILADGTATRASEDENPDLFWAIRGGGGNFGVVTTFEFALHEVGPDVLSGLIAYPLEAAPEVLRFYREFAAKAPDELSCWFVMRKAPPLPFLPEEWHGREILALAVCYCGHDLAEGERILQPLRSYGQPIADVIAPHPYTVWQAILDPLLIPGKRNYWKSHDFRELSDGLIDVLINAAWHLPDPQTEVAFAQLGGAVSRVPSDATAYGHRDAQFVLNTHARWDDPDKDDAGIGWARDLFRAATPYATGSVYVNFMSQDEQERVRAAYGENYARLVQIKNRYDPDNLFCHNQNIRPSR